MSSTEILEKLKAARRQLDALQEVVVLEDWEYDDSICKWFIKLQIHIETSRSDIPAYSHWFLTTENHYPQGSIKVYPAAENSITATFPHQANNGRLTDNQLWRKGALCLDVSAPFFAERNISEPIDIDGRLLWHVKRTIDWIRAANDGHLQEANAYFELPQFQVISDRTFIFSEDYFSAMQWEDIEADSGYADVSLHQLGGLTYRVKEFLDRSMKSVHPVNWGSYFNKIESINQRAIWIMLKHTPIINVWQAPNTYAELVEAINTQGIVFTDILRSLTSNIRDGRGHLLLLGFPIPKLIFSDEQQVFWQALLLPVLSYGKQTANGFRAKKESSYWHRDKIEVLRRDTSLDWIDSQNWNQDEITSRGKMDNAILRKRVMIIGAGCIGSTLAEMLVRAGVYSLTIVDCDILEIGNMSRHVLNLNDVGGSKEQALGNHLNNINPNINIKIETKKIRYQNDLDAINIVKYDVILDCTGSNDVLALFNDTPLKKDAFFISIAIGIKARCLFLYLARTESRDLTHFTTLLKKTIKPGEILADDFPRDGFGCWHPKFPARSEDIWLASSTAIKIIENYVVTENSVSQSMVLEQRFEDGVFTGYCIKEKLSS